MPRVRRLRSSNLRDGHREEHDLVARELDASASDLEVAPPPRKKRSAGPRYNALTSARARPFVVPDDVIVISSDSDDDPLPRKLAAVKSQVHNTSADDEPLSQDNDFLKRHVERQPLTRNPEIGRKRSPDVDEEDKKDRDCLNLRKKLLQMQAENKRIRSKLAASEKEVAIVKKQLMGKNIDGMRQYCECDLCMETLWQPWALSDCGHTYCQTCLITLFNAHKFECPTCRVHVQHRPVEVFAFKNLVSAIAGPVRPEVDSLADPRHVWDAIWPRGGRARAHPIDNV